MVHARGWTLIELVVVITILGIVAAIAAPRGFDPGVFAARGFATEVASAARLTRSIAAASACPIRLTVDAAGYRARSPAVAGTHCASTAGGFPRTVARADGTTLQGTTPSGIVSTANQQWTFNADGTVAIVGGVSVAIGVHRVTVDRLTGLVTGP